MPQPITSELAAGVLRAVLEAVDDGLLLLDPQRGLVLANRRFYELFGLPMNADLATVRAHLADCMASPSAYLAAVSEEVDGSELDLELVRPERRVVRRRVAAVVDEGGTRTGWLVSYRDITHDAEVNRLKNEFVANVSHELRTPMAAIKGFLNVVLEDEQSLDAEQRRQFLGIARQQTERLSRLIDDLLDISRIEAGRHRPVLTRFSVRELVRDAAAAVVPEAELKGLSLEVLDPPEAWLLLADRDQVAQVLVNLLSNAVKFTTAGRVRLSAERDDGELRLRVADTGCGIAAEDVPLVFEKFYRCRDIGIGPQGTGLGLAIARELVEGHRGRIEVSSELGVGSTFTVCLPRAEEGRT